MNGRDDELLGEAERLSQRLLVAAGELRAFAQQLRQATEQLKDQDRQEDHDHG